MGSDPAASEDVVRVSAVISDTVLCASCIAQRTRLPGPRVQAALTTIEGTRLMTAMALCEACLTAQKVFKFE